MTPLRQRMLEELQRRNYSPYTTRGYILAVKQFAEYFGKSPDRLGAEEVRQLPTVSAQRKEIGGPDGQGPHVGLALPLPESAEASRYLIFDDLPLPEDSQEVARRAESRGSDATDRSGTQSDAPHDPDASLCHGHSPGRSVAAEGERYR